MRHPRTARSVPRVPGAGSTGPQARPSGQPLPGSSRPVHGEGMPIHFHQSGEGPVALFVHGFPLDHSMWAAQVRGLGDMATCVAPDLSGFGASPHDGSERLSMERHADDLARILDHLGVEQADVIALSMGGYVALAMWELHAERVRSIALVDTRSEADDAAGKDARDAARERLGTIGRERFAEEMLPKLVGPNATPEVREELMAMMTHTAHETLSAALIGMRDRPDRSGLLASIHVPSLVVCGELDVITPPASARAMAAAIPGAELEIVEGVGHMAPMEAPDAVTAALRRFLVERVRRA